MTDLTPPPMSEEHRARLLLELNSLTADGPSEMFSLIVDRVSAARDEQWRQRLEQFGWVIHQDGEPADASCIWSQKPNEDELKFLANTLGPDASPLVVEPLYRIKEQG